ncbi:unnamed protein product [Bubo scandiacus]
MGAVGNDPDFRFHSPYAQQKYHNISCFWEKQPRGCLRISCAFHHSKPRHINGLFLPPTNNAPLQQAMQEEILPPAPQQESRRHQQHIPLPIHPPLIINLGDEEDDEDDEEENYVPNWVPKTDADIEEERAIKEICYKSGEYYRIQPPREHQSTNTESSPREKELSPSEATNRDLQKGNNVVSIPHQAVQALLRGYLLHPKTVPKEGETSPFPRGIHTSNPRVKPSSQQRGQRKGDETDSSPLCVCTQTGRKSSFRPPEPRRKAYVVYRSVTAKQEPKFSEATGIHTSNPRVKPSSQQRGQRKGDETDSSPLCVCTQTGRKSSFRPPEPRRKAYVVYRSVTAKQEPKFSEATGGLLLTLDS